MRRLLPAGLLALHAAAASAAGGELLRAGVAAVRSALPQALARLSARLAPTACGRP
jgi:hypothetical protein